ncbi:WD40 repeat containing protein [Rhodotorula toruloides]|uniref:WD40 repeat containing protein n=1 Tax=Rhodotorula toruloides TaxID=5286 RepID=A0A511KHL6_RHOTO|nr:WD40 repeat containing protein [Rhodotorula toruloides]
MDASVEAHRLVARFLRSQGYSAALDSFINEVSHAHPRLPCLLDADPTAGDAGEDLQDLVENAVAARLARLRVDDPTSSLRDQLVGLELKEVELPKCKARTVVREMSNVLTVQRGVLPKREWDTQQHRFQCNETPCLFTTAVDRTLKAYALDIYALLDSFSLPSPCLSFAQHPVTEHRRFVTCAMMDGSTTVLDLVTREVKAKVQGHNKYIVRVCWSPDGRHLATLGYDKLVRVYRFELSAPASTSSSEPTLLDDEAPDHLAFCPDVRLNLVHTIESRTNPEAALWLPDSQWLVWSARDDHLLRYLRVPDDDADEWQTEEVNLNENGDSFTSFSVLSIGLHPTLPLLSLQTSTLSARILLYPFHTATRLLTLHTTASQSDYFNPRHAWLPSGAGVVVNSEDGLLRIIDLRGRVRVSQGAHGAAAPADDGEEGLTEEVRSERARLRREADKGSSVIRDVEVLVNKDDKGSVTGWKVVSCGFDKTVKVLE